MSNLLIVNANIITLGDDPRILAGQALGIVDGRISAIGRRADLESQYS